MRSVHLGALLAILAALVVVFAFAARPPRARSVDAPPQEFSAERALVDVRALTATGLSHHLDHPVEHDRVRDLVTRRLVELGLSPVVQDTTSCLAEAQGPCARVQNVVARVGEGSALMLVAHYDSARGGPGASDDGAGVATVLEIVRAIRQEPRRRSLVVLLTDGEELGLLGARAFVREHPWARDISVVLNFEARGTSGQAAMFETSAGSGRLVEVYGRVVNRPVASSVVYTLYKALPNDTDLTVFKAAGMQGLNFAFADEVWNYHTENDDVQHLDPRSLQHLGDQGLAMTRALLGAPEIATPAARDAVWFEVFTVWLVVYRAWVAIALALVQLALLAYVLNRSVRLEVTSVRALASGLGRFLVILLAAVVAGFVASKLIVLFAGRARPWWSSPFPSWLAFVASAVAASSALCLVLDRHLARGSSPVAGSLGGALLAWSALSVFFAFVVPGASYLFVWPAVAGSLGLFIMTLTMRGVVDGPWRTTLAVSLGASIAAFLWFPLVRVLLVMVGAEVHLVTTFPIAMVATLVLPLQRGLDGRSRGAWILPVFATVVALGAMATAVAR